MGQPSISVTKVLANLGMVQARCGCKPGREADGWQEVRSDRCEQAEWQQIITAVRRTVLTLTRGA